MTRTAAEEIAAKVPEVTFLFRVSKIAAAALGETAADAVSRRSSRAPSPRRSVMPVARTGLSMRGSGDE